MELKARSIQVDEKEPFANDLLGRQSEIENLTELLRNVNTPLVLSINGRWGTGKSTFIEMWAKHLQEDLPVLIFNAWTTDFTEDPLVAFLGEMNIGLEKYLVRAGQVNPAWERAKKIGGSIAKRGIPALARILTAGVLDVRDLVENEAVDIAGSAAEDAVRDYEATRNKISEFKMLLEEVINGIDSSGPLVIFIDELDRCRPTYAIELLERIKHIFDQKGIIFVLAMDREQLCHSIGAVYGGIDAVGYLRRFIDLEYKLTIPSKKHFIRQLGIVFNLEGLFFRRTKNGQGEHEYEHLLSVMLKLTETSVLPLREIEQLYSRLSIALHACPHNERISTPLLAFLVFIRHIKPAIYPANGYHEKFIDDALDFIHAMKSDNNDLDLPIALIEGGLLTTIPYGKIFTSNYYKTHDSTVENSSGSVTRRQYSQNVLDCINYLCQSSGGINLTKLVNRIELASELIFTKKESI
jgi:hypothetical protein